MKVVVDIMPVRPIDCLFSEFVHVIDGDVLDRLEEEGEVETCCDCGGIVIDDEYVDETYICRITDEVCSIERVGLCDCLVERTKGDI